MENTSGVPIPPVPSFEKDSPEAYGRALARYTGGAFFEARDVDSLRAVWERIDALETSPFRERRYARLERFLPLLLAALVLFGLAHLAESTVLECLP